MRVGALLQRRDIVANKRVHHMVGGKVFDTKVLDPLHCGLQIGHACRGGPGSPYTFRIKGSWQAGLAGQLTFFFLLCLRTREMGRPEFVSWPVPNSGLFTFFFQKPFNYCLSYCKLQL
jgi:hypothetical protein